MSKMKPNFEILNQICKPGQERDQEGRGVLGAPRTGPKSRLQFSKCFDFESANYPSGKLMEAFWLLQ